MDTPDRVQNKESRIMTDTPQDTQVENVSTTEKDGANTAPVVENTTQTTVDGATSPEQTNGASSGQGDSLDWLPARLDRASQKAVKDLLSRFGLEEPANIEAIIAENEAFKLSQMSDAEKQQAETEKRQAAFEALQAENQTLQQKMIDIEQSQLNQRRESAMQSALANTLSPDAVYLLIKDKYPDEFAAVLTEDGKVDETAIKALIDKASSSHGQLFRVSNSVGSPPSANRAHSGQSPKMSEEELQKQIRRF